MTVRLSSFSLPADSWISCVSMIVPNTLGWAKELNRRWRQHIVTKKGSARSTQAGRECGKVLRFWSSCIGAITAFLDVDFDLR